ncbi:LysR family transcriptional regulator [Spongiibacter sp. UBA1325]|jgi:LysR family carnitine catabolism transcriptional activator|uniref:LysR family transcriptional regulator n=1 Tax=Spongiibacter TaxID=630749 RepID=UPI00257C6F8F|nr:LysR family transcriptional regulator [Spongiibacter sp. UBA1325]|tara:strand:- start:7529 stop:8410 length:882 start_codon:yes stop_codon:yes gene_type:complete
MNVSVKQLRAFVAVAETGSFAQACEQLNISQPALSMAVKNLEDEVGGSLFLRSTRSLSLSPEGSAFLPTAQRLLRDWSDAFTDLQRLYSLQQGKLTIAAMPSFASTRLPAVLTTYRQKFPNIDIAVRDIVMEELIEAVRAGRVELGVAFEPDDSEGLEFEALFTDRFVAVFPEAHPLLTRSRLRIKDLLGDTVITLNRGSSTRRWTEDAFARESLSPPAIFEAFQLTTVGAMVAAGLGVALVPALCEEQMHQLGACCKPISGRCIERRVGIIRRRRQQLSSAAVAMRALLMES